jgi:hypothetical protein
MKEPKITICPPAEQDVFFQETQFDDNLPGRGGQEGKSNSAGLGTDPIRYCQGKYPDYKSQKAPSYGSKAQQTKLKKAEKELEGHENKDEILKILRRGL